MAVRLPVIGTVQWDGIIRTILRRLDERVTAVEGGGDPSQPITITSFFRSIRANGTDGSFAARIEGDTEDRFLVLANGQVRWGDGTGQDTTLERSGIRELHANSSLVLDGALEVAGVPVTGKGPTIQVFTASGVWSSPDRDNLKAIRVRAIGGGGSGGGCQATGAGETASAGGGGGGEYREAIIDVAASGLIGASVNIGTGGGAASAGGNGNIGGNSSFGGSIVAAGGEGGSVGVAGSTGGANRAPGGNGGSGGSGGDIAVEGDDGGIGHRYDQGVFLTGFGGGTVLAGIQPRQSSGAAGDGAPGKLYGGGSSGATSGFGSSARGSTPGADGVIIIDHYF